jgi:hypothetical protein
VRVGRALIEKGRALVAVDRSTEALASYDAVIERLGAVPDGELAEHVSSAWLGQSARLRALGRAEEAESAADAAAVAGPACFA